MTVEFQVPARPWRQAEAIASSTAVDSVTLLDLDSPDGIPVTLTGTALAIWSAVDGHSTTEDIVDVVAEVYGMPPQEVRGEVQRFLQHLFETGLIAAG